jgi:hypothetical protein
VEEITWELDRGNASKLFLVMDRYNQTPARRAASASGPNNDFNRRDFFFFFFWVKDTLMILNSWPLVNAAAAAIEKFALTTTLKLTFRPGNL